MIKQEKGNNVRTLNKVKKLKKLNQLDTNLANEWITTQKKPHIITTCDLNYLITRYNHHQMVRWVASILSTGTTLAFFGYWLSKTPEQVNIDSMLPLSLLATMVGVIIYVLLRPQSPGKIEVFRSVRDFAQDWKEMKALERKGYVYDYRLHNLGQAIAEAQRRLNEPEANRLKKQLRKNQRTILAFGRGQKDWAVYIPDYFELGSETVPLRRQ